MHFYDWPVSRKLTSAFCAVIVAFCTVAAVVVFNFQNIKQTSALRERSEAQVAKVDTISKSMLDLAGQVRAYLLTQDKFFLKGIRENYESAQAGAHDLEATADSAHQLEQFQAMDRAIQGYKTDIVDVQLAAKSPEEGALLMKAGAKKKWMAAFRAAEKAFVEEARAVQAQRTADRNKAVALGQAAIFAGAAVAMLVAAVAALLLHRLIGAPIRAMSTAMRRLADGDHDVLVPQTQRRDEVGQMAASVQQFKTAAQERRRLAEESAAVRNAAEAERQHNEAAIATAADELRQVVQDLGAGLSRLSQGDLTCRVDSVFAANYRTLQTDFNAAIQALQDAMTEISVNSQGIGTGVAEISRAADDLSRRTERQAASLEETAAALDHITTTVRKTAQSASAARQIVSAAKSDALASEKVVTDAVGAMQNIEASSLKISMIISVIDDIAFQTNLLALNAGVEAARAGDAGRGFAVVASEVRGLAQRAAEAAKEIKQLISASSGEVGVGVAQVGETGKALARIIAQVAQIDTVVQDIASSAVEEANGLQAVNDAVNQMDQATQQNAAMVEQTTAASHFLRTQAEALMDRVAGFNVGQANSAASPFRRPATALRRSA
jgi:methyl-accepting chemotaxis protein